MHHIMVDLETLGTNRDSIVLSIGLVAFDPTTKEIGEKLYIELTDTIEDQQNQGRTMSAATFRWWLQQGAAARMVFSDPPQPGVKRPGIVASALTDIMYFFQRNGGDKIELWGNGADFDNVILASLFETYLYKVPWSFSRNRCFRTMKRLSGIMGNLRIQTPPFAGVPHNALDDALQQVTHLQEIFACLAQGSSASRAKPVPVKTPSPAS